VLERQSEAIKQLWTLRRTHNFVMIDYVLNGTRKA